MAPPNGIYPLPILSYRLVKSTGSFQPMPLDRQHHIRQQATTLKALHFSLLLVCRQMYLESKLLPFRLNTFVFDSPRLFRFISFLRPEQRNAVRSLEISFTLNRTNDILLGPIMCNENKFIAALASLPGLKKLVLNLDYISWRSREELQVKLLHDVDGAAQRIGRWVRAGKGEEFTYEVKGTGLLENWGAGR